MDVSRITEATFACFERAQRSASTQRRDQFGVTDLLPWVLADSVVKTALSRAGVSRSAMSVLPRFVGQPARRAAIVPDDDVVRLTDRAILIAKANEHSEAEPGHLALASLEPPYDSTSVLEQVGEAVDVCFFRGALLELMWTAPAADAAVLRDDQDFPPLDRAEVRLLLRRLIHTRDDDAHIGEQGASSSRSDAADLHNMTHLRTWGRLVDHHRYLVIGIARECADQGHRLPYAYALGLQGLADALSLYTESDGEFAGYAYNAIKQTVVEELHRDIP